MNFQSLTRVAVLSALALALPLAGQSKAKTTKAKGATTQSVAAAPAVDQEYSAQIAKFTTEPFFTSDYVRTLPASATIPTPLKVLGYIAGAEQHLTYSKDLYRYYDALAAASPRVKIFTMGTSEEGREIKLLAISSEENIAKLEQIKTMNAEIADPRLLDANVAHAHVTPDNVPANAQDLISKDVPFYWITGSIHSEESGSPEMLMELAYRLAADPSPFYDNIRKNLVVLITPVIEVDGHDRFVDVYDYHVAHPNQPQMPLIYWGHYVAHDNNRDAMGLSLKLSQAAIKTFLDYHPLVLHDLHESESYLYDNTLGTEPFNPWLDPIATEEWEQIAWYNVDEMTKRGMPGVYTFGTFTTWDPSYLYFVANAHNAIGRLYETQGNGGADTRVVTLGASSTSRTWWRQNPPLARAVWSQRDNTNYEETGLLVSLDLFARQREQYVRNYYLKSARSVAKAYAEGPAAYVFPGDDPRTELQSRLLNMLQEQGVEISRAASAFTVDAGGPAAGGDSPQSAGGTPARGERAAEHPRTFAAGTFVARMDQPYSRMADMLLDQEYYSPADRQPYDDSGWTQGVLRNVEVVRITDSAVLDVPMQKLSGPYLPPGGTQGTGTVFAVANHADPNLTTLRYKLKDVAIEASDVAFDAGDRHFPAGSFLIPASASAELQTAATQLGITAVALADMPAVSHHSLDVPRVALVHGWTNTQQEGWWRIAFDNLQIPYDYIDDHYLRDHDDLRQTYDVIIYPPGGGNADRLINGVSGPQPIPWKQTPEMPNIGTWAQSDDIRGGLDLTGVVHIRDFVKAGGLFISALNTSDLLIQMELAPGVTEVTNRGGLRARGSVLNASFADSNSPIAYGYDAGIGVYYNNYTIYNAAGGGGRGGRGGAAAAGGGRGAAAAPGASGAGGEGAAQGGEAAPPADFAGGRGGRGDAGRVSGRGTDEPGDGDIPQGRPDETDYDGKAPDNGGGRGGRGAAGGPTPRVIVRFADANHLLYSGQLADGAVLANKPAVIDQPLGQGHMMLFGIDPMYRGETEGCYAMIFNAMLNYTHLDLGSRPAAGRGRGAASDPGQR